MTIEQVTAFVALLLIATFICGHRIGTLRERDRQWRKTRGGIK